MKDVAWRQVFVCACLIGLVGCERVETEGPDAQGYKWQKELPPLEPVRVHVGVDVYLNCGFEEHAQSCAVRRPDGCDIYLPSADHGLQPWMEPHERKHCAGWVHPDWTRGR